MGNAKRFRRSADQQHSRDGSRLTHTGRDHVGLDELHGVVNGEARGDRAARGIDVNLNVFFRVFRLKKKHLRDSQVGDVVVNRRADKNDVLFQEPRINVVGAFAPAGLFDHHGYKRGSAIIWFVRVFHCLAWLNVCGCER